ncbi:phage/plasmid primase, P4 family [Deinococcus radiopugnans]|nr:phage/plasmid primase, P4 family [Deinococcus radiopugnans]MBB6018644.1 P4 family phage/plasmid primase-like protein [Deinococcus radiopugnans ATCC 19172]
MMRGHFNYDPQRADRVNGAEAIKLLDALHHPGERVWLQTFADGPDELYVLTDKPGKNGRSLVKSLQMSGVPGHTRKLKLKAVNEGWVSREELVKCPYLLENQARCGVFFAVNGLTPNARQRKTEHVERVAAIFLDLDGAEMPTDLPLQPTATVQSSAGRHHVYWAVDGVPLEEFGLIQTHLATLYGADPAVKDLPRVMRLPGYYHGKGETGELVKLTSITPEAQYTRADLLEAWPSLAETLAAAEAERERQQQDAHQRREEAERLRAQISAGDAGTRAEGQQKYGRVALLGLTADLLAAPVGQRNSTLNAVAYRAGRLIGAGVLEESEARAELGAVAKRVGLETGETAAALGSGMKAGKAKPADTGNIGKLVGVKREKASKALALAREKVQKGPVKAGGPSYIMPRFPKGVEEGTDAANALILAGNHLGERLRYTFGVGWYVYDQQRGIWREDDGGLTLSSQVAGEVLRAVVADHVAALVKARAKDEELNPAITWARNVGSNWAIANALKAAAGRPEFLTDVAAWDAQPDLLNCRNGVLELTTGTLRPHAPSDLLTWQAGAAFDPAARHPYVDQLTELLKRDGRHDFLQRLVGSALYGEAPNEVAILLEGEGMTGKGTLVSATVAMLGDYATTINVELLLSNSHGESGSGPKPELLKLRGKRLAVAGEPPKGARFNAGRVKGMTGNDPITARAMRSNILVEFKPVFKLWIHTNYPINTAHDDTGMQRRLRVVPFKAKPERPYAAFKSTLENDATARAALLNWAYEGFRLWHASGFELGMSAEIEAATGSYWKEQNPYEKFAAACLIFSENAEIQSGRLKTLFEEWAEENGAKMGRAVKMADLYTYLQTLGCEPRRTKSGRFWNGVTEVTEVTPQPQLREDIHTREMLNRGQAVIGVTSVTRDDGSVGQLVGVGWEGEEL